MKQKLLFLILFLCTSLLWVQKTTAQTLSAGDIAFIGYNTDSNDGFSFITLTEIPAGEIIYFSEQGWTGSAWVNNVETHLRWTATSTMSCGTVVSISEITNDDFNVSSGTVNIAANASFSLIAGDQILAYQSASGPAPASPTFIAGVHGDYNSGNFNPSTGWNATAISSGSESVVPTGLTNGVNCVSLFPTGSGEIDNARYNGTLTGTPDALRASINNYTNWISDNDTAYDITPSVYSPNVTCTVAPPLPVVTTNPSNSNICVNSNTSFSIAATDGDTYQWQVDSGTGFSNITNSGVYSNATTTTLNITGATASMGGYSYRCIVSNSTGNATSGSATLSISNITLSGSQSNVSCYGGTNGAAAVSPAGGFPPYTYSWAKI